MNRRCLFSAVAVMLIWLLLQPLAHAHRVTIFAWIEGQRVYTESKFPGGRHVIETPVVVYDGQGNRLLAGKTDDTGRFSFEIPKAAPLDIVLEAGQGHQAEWQLSEKEVRKALGKSVGDAQARNAGGDESTGDMGKGSESARRAADPPTPADAPPCLDAERVQEIVEASLERKMTPIMQSLAALQTPGPTLTDILGGIGYIIGLSGIGFYVAARKK